MAPPSYQFLPPRGAWGALGPPKPGDGSESEVLDRLQHLRHERRSRPDEGGANRPRADANGRIVRAEAASVQRIIRELVAVAVFLLLVLGQSHRADEKYADRRHQHRAPTRSLHVQPPRNIPM